MRRFRIGLYLGVGLILLIFAGVFYYSSLKARLNPPESPIKDYYWVIKNRVAKFEGKAYLPEKGACETIHEILNSWKDISSIDLPTDIKGFPLKLDSEIMREGKIISVSEVKEFWKTRSSLFKSSFDWFLTYSREAIKSSEERVKFSELEKSLSSPIDFLIVMNYCGYIYTVESEQVSLLRLDSLLLSYTTYRDLVRYLTILYLKASEDGDLESFRRYHRLALKLTVAPLLAVGELYEDNSEGKPYTLSPDSYSSVNLTFLYQIHASLATLELAPLNLKGEFLKVIKEDLKEVEEVFSPSFTAKVWRNVLLSDYEKVLAKSYLAVKGKARLRVELQVKSYWDFLSELPWGELESGDLDSLAFFLSSYQKKYKELEERCEKSSSFLCTAVSNGSRLATYFPGKTMMDLLLSYHPSFDYDFKGALEEWKRFYDSNSELGYSISWYKGDLVLSDSSQRPLKEFYVELRGDFRTLGEFHFYFLKD